MTSTIVEPTPGQQSPVQRSEQGPYIPIKVDGFRLTTWRESDVDDAVALFGHSEVGKWSCYRPFPYTTEHFDYISSVLPELSEVADLLISSKPLERLFGLHTFPISALRDIATQRVVGFVSATSSVRDKGQWEVAYDVLPEYQGRGLGKAMIFAMLDMLRWLGVKRVVAYCESANLPSAGLLKRTGFSHFTNMVQAWPHEKGGGERELHGFQIEL